MKLVLQIALGVFLGIMLSAVLSVALWGGIFLKLLPALLSTQMSSAPVLTLPKPSQEALIAAGIIGLTPAATQPVIQPELGQPPVDTRTAAEIAAQQRQLELQQQIAAAQEEKRKKDLAFKSWYHKPPLCVTPNDHGHDVMVACGNHHARARTEFDELWQQGKFKN